MLLYHSWLISGAPRLDGGVIRAAIGSGWIGVDVFFVLSGFVHFLPVARRGTVGPWRDYARRRLARVVPAYYLALIVVLILVKTVDFPGLLAHLAFLQVPFFGFSRRVGLNADQPMWTLSIEAIFYVVLVLVASRFVKQPWLWCGGALVIAAAWKLWTADDMHRGIQFPGFVAHFALGMAIAVVFVNGRWDSRWTWPLLIGSSVLFVAAAAAVVDTGANEHFSRNLTLAIPLTGIVLAGAFGHWPVIRPLRFFSNISYGVYLFHILVIGRLIRYIEANGTTGAFLKVATLTTVISIAIGYASLRLVETPLRRLAAR